MLPDGRGHLVPNSNAAVIYIAIWPVWTVPLLSEEPLKASTFSLSAALLSPAHIATYFLFRPRPEEHIMHTNKLKHTNLILLAQHLLLSYISVVLWFLGEWWHLPHSPLYSHSGRFSIKQSIQTASLEKNPLHSFTLNTGLRVLQSLLRDVMSQIWVKHPSRIMAWLAITFEAILTISVVMNDRKYGLIGGSRLVRLPMSNYILQILPISSCFYSVTPKSIVFCNSLESHLLNLINTKK